MELVNSNKYNGIVVESASCNGRIKRTKGFHDSDSFQMSRNHIEDDHIMTIPNQSINELPDNSKIKQPRFQRRQLFTLITLAYGNFWIAACVSLQAPFFPKEAESKGKLT